MAPGARGAFARESDRVAGYTPEVDDDATFSEGKAAEVLKRAARLQSGEAEAPGVSRAELARIAAEAGISPANLEAAIRAETSAQGRSNAFGLGASAERVVESEFDPSDFDAILAVAPPARSLRHPVEQIGRTLKYQTRYRGGFYRIEVVSRAGRTHVRVAPVTVMTYLMTLHLALLAAFVGGLLLMATGSALTAILFAFAVVTVGIVAFSTLSRRVGDRVGDVADAVEASILETGATVHDAAPTQIAPETERRLRH